MMPQWINPTRFRTWPVAIVAACLCAGAGAATTNLADAPLGSTVIVPANVILDISVEFPTADDAAYINAYDPVSGPNITVSGSLVTDYTGYFNPKFCYSYDATKNYFTPQAASGTGHTCTGQWSGNFLNWALTQTIDPLRKTLTGGYRSVDTSSNTVLQKAYSDSNVGSGGYPNKTITGTAVTGATPFSWTSLTIANRNTGLTFYLSSDKAEANSNTLQGGFVLTAYPGDSIAAGGTTVGPTNTGGDPTCSSDGNWNGGPCTLSINVTTTTTVSSSVQTVTTVTKTCTARSGSSSGHLCTNTNTTTTTSTSTAAYQLYAAAQVCSSVDASSDLATSGGRCRGYPYGSASPSVYKPVGLMQKYAAETSTGKDSIRYSVFGYLSVLNGSTANAQLDGGVMRAKMKSVGPYMADPGTTVITNTYNATTNPAGGAEWSATDGTFVKNPNSADASATPSVTGSTPTTSGVVNYLNGFGFSNNPVLGGVKAYKTYDSVGELYYMALRYYRNLGNLASHTNTATAITNGEATNDHFPVITTWDDPIPYSCSTNYVIGIGDQHTWNDGNLPGSTLNGGNEVADAGVTADAGVNVTTATNYIGNLEKVAGYTGAGGDANPSPPPARLPLPGATANNSSDLVSVANLGSIFVNSSMWGSCCTGNTFYMAGLAFDAHVRDIRPDITNKTSPVTVSTFWLDVMENNDYHEKNPFWLAAKYGGFNTSDPSFGVGGYPIVLNNTGATPGSAAAAITYSTTLANTPLAVSSWNTGAYVDEKGNYSPDQYFEAGNPAAMTTGLNSAFAKIAANIPSGTSTALSLGSSTVAASGNANYATSFAKDYSGDLVGSQLAITSTGGVVSTTSTVKWHARDWLPNTATAVAGVTPLTATNRIIATSSTVGAAKGVAFEMTSGISSAEAATLGADSTTQTKVLNYVRGDQTNESAAGFRPRIYTLGDIIDSKPVVQAAPSLPYADTPLNPGYSAFKSTWSSRGPIVYVGANDGMMHAFDGSMTSASGGKELFAYVPSYLFNTNVDVTGNPVGLASLVVNPLQHHFMVDAQPALIDVDFARTRASGSAPASTVASDWHSILVSGLGKGGKGFFALDVTDPSTMTSESAVAGKVLWETNPATFQHMGYSYGTPLVVKTVRYGWTVVLTSGYGNDDGQGYLYLVSPKDGTLYETISTGAGSLSAPAGLTFVGGYINNFADYTADSLYAGDLLGNVWRVDLTSTSSAAAVQKFATLADSSSNPQPVTTEPVVTTDPGTHTRYVFVGTGRLLADTDLVSSAQQTFYAFTDGDNTAFDPGTTTLTRTDLANNSTPVTGVTVSSTQRGYYIDLATYAASAGMQAAAERVNVQPVASGGVVSFAANLFGQDPCSAGSSRLFALGYDTSGGVTGKSLLTDSAGTPVAAFTNPAPGVITSLSIVSTGSGLKVLAGLSTGTVNGVSLSSLPASLQKLNWREVPTH